MKKLLALLLSLVMVLSLVPNVWGTDDAQPEETPPETVKTEEIVELQAPVETEETVDAPEIEELPEAPEGESEEKTIIEKLQDAGYKAPAEGEDVTFIFPEELVRGVDYDYTYVDGLLTVGILPGQKAHWEAAYQNNSVKSGNNIIFSTEFVPPEEAKSMAKLCSNSEYGAVTGFINDTNEYHEVCPHYQHDEPLAAVNEQMSSATIAPTPYDNGLYLLVAYKDSQGSIMERWMIRYRILAEESFLYKTSLKQNTGLVARDRIVEFDMLDTANWETPVIVSDGLVTIKAKSANIPYNQRICDMYLSAPAGCTTGVGQIYTQTCFWVSSESNEYWVNWVDSSGNTIGEHVTVQILSERPYLANNGTPSACVMPDTTGSGIIVAYDPATGYYHTSFAPGIIPTAEQLKSSIVMQVPENAKSYRWINYLTNRDPYSVSGGIDTEALGDEELCLIGDASGYTVPIANVGEFTLREAGLTFYYSRTRNYTERIIQWYSDEGGTQTLGRPVYIFGYNDDFAWTTSTSSVDRVTTEVDAPTLIGSGLTLVGTRYPQECGDNSLYIELAVIGGTAGKNNEVYLPYSYFGITYRQAQEWKLAAPMIRHYDESSSSSTVIRGEYTEYGVKFVTPSFSPFTITCDPLRGDINGDGIVNGSDMQCLYEYLTTGSSTSPLSGKLLEVGLNVNKADGIDVYDLQRLYEFINGINPNW